MGSERGIFGPGRVGAARRIDGIDAQEWADIYSHWISMELETAALRAQYELAPAGFTLLDRHGCIRRINSTGGRILGRRPASMIGGTLLSLVDKRDRKNFLTYLARVRNQKGTSTAEFRFSRPDGTQPLLQLISDSDRSIPGLPEHIRAIITDVTDYRRLELELSESRAELAAITESMRDAVISVGPDQRIVQCNRAAEEMFGCPGPRIMGMPVAGFFPERFRGENEKILTAVQQGRSSLTARGTRAQLWGQRASGEVFPIEVSLSQHEVKGASRTTLVMRDITERRLAEQQILRLNQELNERVRDRTARLEAANRELVREVAERRHLQSQLLQISDREQRRIGQDLHDGVGQYLTGLMLLNDTLLREVSICCPAKLSAARRIRRLLVETQREVHRLAAGLLPVPGTPDGLATALGALARRISGVYRTECGFECSRGVEVKNVVAANHLFRIAQEAVHNAVRHGRAKKITVSLSVRQGRLRLSIVDNGAGRAPEKEHAHGLGLGIMRSRCEAMGASLQIRHARPTGVRIVCVLSVTPPYHSELNDEL